MLGDQLLIAERLFDGIEVGALDVLDNCKLQRCAIVNLPYDDGNFIKSRQLGRAPTALAGDDFEPSVGN